MDKRKLHDGIVGILVTLGMWLGYAVSPKFYLLPTAIGVLLIQSAITGFCPVYFLLDKAKSDCQNAPS